MTADTVISLYQHGALVCAAIVALYLLLRWGVGHVPFLEQPQHAHYATIAVAVIGVFAVPAAAGQLPNLNMALAAAATLTALLLPGVAASPKTSQSGRARLTLVALIALIAVASCGWWSSSGKPAAGLAGKTAEACAISDLEQYGADVAKDLSGNDYTVALEQFKQQHNFTQDAVNCLVRGVLAGLGAVIAGEMHGEPSPVLLHGKAYLAAQKSAMDLPPQSVQMAAMWLAPPRAGCDSQEAEPAIDCRPFQPEVYDGCHWVCR